jgi:hypothetical protein
MEHAAPRTNPKHLDLTAVHRELAGYYGAFGLLNASTPSSLLSRVVLPNLIHEQQQQHIPKGGSTDARRRAA